MTTSQHSYSQRPRRESRNKFLIYSLIIWDSKANILTQLLSLLSSNVDSHQVNAAQVTLLGFDLSWAAAGGSATQPIFFTNVELTLAHKT